MFDPRARSKSRQRSVSHSTRASATVAPQAFKQPLCPAVQFGASQTRVPVAHPKMEQGHWTLCNCVWAEDRRTSGLLSTQQRFTPPGLANLPKDGC